MQRNKWLIESLTKPKGNNKIMVINDRFIKYAHFITPSHPFTAQDVAPIFLDHFCKFHGPPASVFTNKFVLEGII
jgi:hypothetical protein